jgi:hypothetical protein
MVTAIATVNIWLRASWYDPQLDWNSSNYSGLGQITVKQDQIWTPEFLAYNHVERFDKEVMRDTELYVYADGWGVFWSRPLVTRVSFDVDPANFPYDTQSVHFDMGAWSNSGLLQNLVVMNYTRHDEAAPGGKRRVTNGEVDTSPFIRSSEFDVGTVAATLKTVYFACCPSEPWPQIVFTAKFQRKYIFYLTSLVVPTVATTLVSFLTFLLPQGCGERVGLGISCLLVVAALMFVSSELIPVTDEPTVLGRFYSVCFGFTMVSLCITVFTNLLYYQSQDIDCDGEPGSHFFTNIVGMSSTSCLQWSFRLDFWSSILMPLTFAMACTTILHPFWTTWQHALGIVALLIGSVVLVLMLLGILYTIRRCLGHDLDKLNFLSVVWSFRKSKTRNSSIGGKTGGEALTDIEALVPSEAGRGTPIKAYAA